MKIIEPFYEILNIGNIPFNREYGINLLKHIERIGRVSYLSEGNITNDSYIDFVSRRLKQGHESIIEHGNISVKIICNRKVTHQLVRHRIASYTQETTNINYSKDKFENQLSFIKPFFWKEDSSEYKLWYNTIKNIEKAYFKMLKYGATTKEASLLIPSSLKTEIVITTNLREWRHIFNLRCTKNAHIQIREVMLPILWEFYKKIPIIFDDIVEKYPIPKISYNWKESYLLNK